MPKKRKTATGKTEKPAAVQVPSSDGGGSKEGPSEVTGSPAVKRTDGK